MRRILSFAVSALVLITPVRSKAQGSPRDNLLVSREWLQAHLNDRDLVLLHVGPREGYDTAHVAGSRFANLDRFDARSAMSLELPSPDSIKAAFEAHGISDNSHIVVIAGNGWFSPATRVILTLDHAGFGGRTVLLDGGLTGWIRARLPTVREEPKFATGKIGTLSLKNVIVSAEAVRDRGPTTALIDARAASFYEGAQEGGNQTIRKKGHIPGAKSLYYLSVLDSTGLFLKPEALREKFTAAGWKPGDSVIAYCHVGQQATMVVFAARTLGIDVKLYDGSFDDWVTRGWPVELPPGR